MFAKAKHVIVTADHINIDEKIQFEQAKASIKAESNGLLDEIATVMNANPQIKKIEIQGHASGEGDAKANTKLSDERAKAVMAALVTRKVKAETLTAKGYGSEKKIAEEKTEADREKNRRVEFLILDPAPKGGAAATTAKPSAPTTASASATVAPKPSASASATVAPKK
jgi:OmpA-OmpF porin, OOP family